MRQGIGLQSYKAIPSCLDNSSWCMARLQAVQARACFQQLLEFHEHMRMGNGQTCMAAERCCVHACLPRTYDVHSCACVLSSGGCKSLAAVQGPLLHACALHTAAAAHSGPAVCHRETCRTGQSRENLQVCSASPYPGGPMPMGL